MMLFPPDPNQQESEDSPRDERSRDLARTFLESGLSPHCVEQKLIERGFDLRNAKWILADREGSGLIVSIHRVPKRAEEPMGTEWTVDALLMWVLLEIADYITGGYVTIMRVLDGIFLHSSRVAAVSSQENLEKQSAIAPEEGYGPTDLPKTTDEVPQVENYSEPETNGFVRGLVFLVIGLGIVSLAITILIAH